MSSNATYSNQTSLLYRSVKQPITAMHLYAPIAWKRCSRRGSATSWAISFPSILYSHYQRRQPTISHLCDRILQTLNDLSSSDIFVTSVQNIQEEVKQKSIILPSIPPITTTTVSTISSDQDPYELSPQQSTLPSSFPNPSDFSSILGNDSRLSPPSLRRTQDLLHGLYIYDSVQLQLPSTCSARSANPDATCEDATDLSVVLPPFLANLNTQQLLKLLMAVRAIHHALRINLANALNEGDLNSNPQNPTLTSTDIIHDAADEKEENNLNHDNVDTNNINVVSSLDNVVVETTPTSLGNNIKLEEPPHANSIQIPSEYSNSSIQLSTLSTPPRRSYITTTDFKIDGWLRLGCSSLLSAFNMCSDAAETLNSGDVHLAAQERDMIRECLSYFVDSGSSSSPGVISCTDDVILQNNHVGNTIVDHRSTWEILIESTISQKTGQQN